MRCIWYSPVMKIDNGGHGGSTWGGECGVNVVVEGGDGEFGCGQGDCPRKPSTECSAFGTGP